MSKADATAAVAEDAEGQSDVTAVEEPDTTQLIEPGQVEPDTATTDQDTGGDDTSATDDTQQPADEGDDGVSVNWDEGLLARAEAIGLTRDQAESTGSNETLASFVGAVEAKTRTPAEPEPDVKADEPKDDGFKIDFDGNEDDYDPGLVKQLNAMNEHYAKLNAEREDRVKALESQGAATADAQYWEAFDQGVTGLGDGFKEFLGDGATKAMDAGSAESKTRNAIADRMDERMAGCEAMGKPVPPFAELQREATFAVLGDKIKKVARRGITDKLDKRTASVRPSSRKVTDNEGTPEENAAAAIRAVAEDKGIDLGPDDGSDYL